MTSLARYDRDHPPRTRPTPIRRYAANAVAEQQSEPVAAHHHDDAAAVLGQVVAWLRDPDGARVDAAAHRALRNVTETIAAVADALDAQLGDSEPTLFGDGL